MAKFTDNQDRPWVLRITTGAIQKIRHHLDIDLADLTGKVEKQLEDEVTLVNVLWLLVEDEAKSRGVSDVQFGEALVGDAIDAATLALLEAKVDFFPSRKRAILREVAAKTAAVREKADALVMAKLNDPTLQEEMAKAMESRLNAEVQAALTRLRSATSSLAPAE